MKTYKIVTLLCFLLLPVFLLAGNDDPQSVSAYDKIFKDKKVITKKGIVTLHLIEGKVFFEYPLNLLNRDLIMGTTVEEVSDIGDSFVGQQPQDPVYLRFTKNDTLISVTIKDNFDAIGKNEDSVENAIEKNYSYAVINNFSIMAYNKDSTSVVFDASLFFLNDYGLFRPFDPAGENSFGGLVVRKPIPNSSRSMIKDIDSYSDNFSITTYQSYDVTSLLFGALVLEKDRPYTALAKRSFMFLPEEPYRPRVADSRIGVYSEEYRDFSITEYGVKKKYYAKRWRLEPSQPIVFYIDNKFPAKWVKSIRAGVERWNTAFEEIGFKNAIIAKIYPENDPQFDPNNLKYNCIKYVPLTVTTPKGPFWTDPRSGQILNANIYIYHNVASALASQRFILTSAADESVRGVNLSDSKMAESLELLVAQEVGRCLGLTPNMAGSASYPVDSLRSPAFTQKYGTTSSIMDYTVYNYIAQPGDKTRGVRLTPLTLGLYDFYAIKWLYSPIITAKTPEDEVVQLNKWIVEKQDDPMFRYAKEQKYYNYDPSSLPETLGDDAVKAVKYGVENLKYILLNANNWLNSDDIDYKFRSELYLQIIERLGKYVELLSTNIGGIYIREKHSGAPYDYYTPVPRERQRDALLSLFDLMENLEWMDIEEEKNEVQIMASIADYCRKLYIPVIFEKIKEMEYSSYLSDTPYSTKEAYEDVFRHLFRYTIRKEIPSSGNIKLQEEFITMLLNESGLNSEKAEENNMIMALTNSELSVQLKLFEGFGYQRKLSKKVIDNDCLAYGYLLKVRDILKRGIRVSDKDTANYYRLMLLRIERALNDN